jgi:hypothetical protein
MPAMAPPLTVLCEVSEAATTAVGAELLPEDVIELRRVVLEGRLPDEGVDVGSAGRGTEVRLELGEYRSLIFANLSKQ